MLGDMQKQSDRLFPNVKAIPTADVIRVFLAALELKRDGSGREKARCPFHDEKTPSFTVYEHGFKCYGCGEYGSNIDLLIKANLASSPLEASKMIAERFEIPLEQKRSYKQQPLTLSDYAGYTGLPENFLVKTFKVRETSSGLEMPYMDSRGKEVAIRTRYRLKAGDGVKWRKGDSLILYGLWGIERITANKRVLLVEGESDTHVLWFNRIPALGVPGANNFKKKWATLFLELPEIVVVQEPDEAGKGFAEDITCALKQAGYKGQVKAVTLPEKDTRDLWLKHGHRFKEELEQAISSTPPLDLESIKVPTKIKKESIPPELEGRFIHPALHIEPGFSSVGIIEREDNQHVFSVVTSSGATYLAEDIKDVLLTKPLKHPDLSGRWQRLTHTQSLSEAAALLIHKMRELVCFEDERWYSVIALWSVGTYLFPAFPAYPYLQLTGEKGSGKSKVQDILNCVAFNALLVVDPTPAVIYRLIHCLKPTLLIDEVEGLNDEYANTIRAILNAGYKPGSHVPRCGGESNDELKFFDVYGPKCLSGIKGLGDTTEDRCITVVMSKPPQEDTRQNQAVNPLDTDWATIRNGFYQLPLTQADSILTSLDTERLPGWLRARDRELWSPLLSLASFADGESGLGLFGDVLGLASESVQDKGLTFEAEAIVGLLESLLNTKDTLMVHPVDLVDGLGLSLDKKVGPQWIAGRLRSLGFKKADPSRDKTGVIYEVKAEKLSEVRCRYAPPENSTPLHTPHPTPSEPVESKEES